jgi:hypothetical protein
MKHMQTTLISILIILSTPNTTTAQQETPTTSPPTSNTQLNIINVLPPTFDPTIEIEPLTQSDLEIITGNVQRPNGITWFNNKLYTACTGDMTLYEIDATTGATLTYIGGVRNAHSLHAEPGQTNNFSLWVPDFGTSELLHITRAGIDRVADDLNGPWGITPLDDETFLITSILDSTLKAITRDGEGEVVLSSLASPTGLATDEEYIYIANNGSTRRAIEFYPRSIADSQDTEQDEGSSLLVSGLQNTTGIVLGADGYLYFTYSLGTRGVVGRVNPIYCRENGGCTNEEVQIVIYTELEAPLAGLTISPDMHLFVHTMFRPEIYWTQIDF